MADNIVLSTTVTMDIHPMIRDSKVAKGELKSLNKSLKAQSKAFKETGYDAEALAERQRLLGHAYKAQNKIVEDTTKAYKEVADNIKDKNNMTTDEANAISITRGQMEKARYELRKYSADMEKTKDQHLQLSKSSAELTKRHKEIGEVTKRTVEQYKKMGSEMGVLKTRYEGLGRQIKNNNIIMNKEKEVMASLKDQVSQNSTVYRHQEIVLQNLQKKHTTLITQQNKVNTSMNRLSGNTDRVSAGMGRMAYGAISVKNGFRNIGDAAHRTSAVINRMGSSFRNIGLVIGGMALGGLIQNISTLIPLGGSLISVLAGVGGMATSLAGAGIGIGGAFGIAMIAVKAFAGQAQTALQMVEDGEMGASSALTHYKSSLSGLQNQWKALVQANSGAIFNTMANGINIARHALTTLNPFLTKTANQISAFSKRMKTWFTDSKNMGSVFNMLNKIGPRVFQNILNSLFKVVDGLAHMTARFAPLFTYMSAGLEKMANGFNKWANSAGTDNSITRFIEYTKKSLPLTGQIFGNVFSGIIDLFQAFSGHSLTVMGGMAGVTKTFRDWAANLSGTQGFKDFIKYLNENGPKAWELLKNVGLIIVGIIKGMAPFGAIMLDMLVATTGFIAKLVDGNPIIGAFLGVLTAVVGAAMQFGPALYFLWKVLAPIGSLIGRLLLPAFKGLWKILLPIAKFIGALLLPALKGLGLAIAGISAPVWGAIAVIGGLIAALAWLNNKITPLDWGKIFGNISAWFQVKWNAFTSWLFPAWGRLMAWFGTAGAWFKSVWNSIWSGIVTFTKWIFGGLITFFTWVWTAISTTTMPIIRSIGNVIRSIFGGIGSFIRWVFNGIKTFFIWIWTSITAVVMPIIRAVGTGIRAVFGGISTFLKWVWGGISSYFTWSWGIIKGIFSWGAQAINVVVRIIFAAIGRFIRWIFNGIASFIKWVWNGIKSSVMFYVNLIKSLVTAAWNILSRVTRAIFNGVKTFLIWVWQTIGVRVVNFVRGLWNGIKYYWNIVSNFTRTIFNAVKNFLIWVWTNIKNRVVAVVRVLWNNIRNNWNIISSFTRRIFNAVKNFLVWVWTNIKNRVVAVVRILWRNITTVWNTLSSTTRRIFNYIKDWLIWVWNNIKNRVVSLARGMWNIVRGIWNTISSVTRKIFNGIKNFLVWLWTTIRDKVVGFARSLWSKVSGTWNNLINGTKGIFNKVRNYLVDKWEGIRDKVTGIASDLWGKVKETFTNMKEGLKGLAGKIGDVITGMVKGIKKGLNSLIKGVNWVAEKLGVDKKIPELSTGTGGTSYAGSGLGAGVSNGAVSSGGFATVNDRGPGNGSGPGGHQEVIQRANGTMVAPKGRDVTVPLGKGDIVHSGKAVQRAQKAGALPKFSRGTNKKKKYDLLENVKKHNHGEEIHGDVPSAFGPSGGGFWDDANKMKDAAVGTVKEGGKKAVVGTVKKAADTTKAAKEKIDDVMSFVGSPGKLVSAMMKQFGVDFGKVNGEIPKDMMWDPMWKGLKGGVKSLFDGWLTEADAGGGDGSYIDLSKGINFPFSPSGRAPGYPFAGPHMGVDINYIYDKLYSVLSGKATARSGWNGGFGNMVDIVNGATKVIYGHMSKHAFSGSKQVEPGDPLGVSGNSGRSSGPHLHFEVQKNGVPIDPIKWLKKNNGSKGGGKYGKQIKQALGMAGLPQSSKYIKAWQEQARTESTFNPKARNPSGASGLVQVKPATFGQYKLPGHGNIWNPLDNLIAGMRYAKARYGAKGMLNQIGHGLPYAKGTNNATRGLHPVHEKGGEIMNLRGGEQVIPNDVSIAALKQMMSSDLFSRTQAAVYAGISRYAEALEQKQEQKRIKELKAQQQANANTTDINELKQMMGQMVYLMQQQLGVQEDIAGTNNAIANKSNVIDVEKTTQKVSEQEAFNLLMSRYNSGLKMD